MFISHDVLSPGNEHNEAALHGTEWIPLTVIMLKKSWALKSAYGMVLFM